MLQANYEGKNVALGDNIKRLRRDKAWTQQQLAEKSGIRVGQVSKLESNKAKPGMDTIYALINALECSPNALLNDVSSTNIDGRLEMALERLTALPDDDKKALVNIIDKYCIAVAYQGLTKNSENSFLGLNFLTGVTEELV
jgi:transcriptional regulator with XRE-family HTH domain